MGSLCAHGKICQVHEPVIFFSSGYIFAAVLCPYGQQRVEGSVFVNSPFGEPMKHIAQELMVEFVRKSLPRRQVNTVGEHLSECPECSDLAALLREIVRVGANEAGYEPPEGIVRTVKAYFEAEQRKSARPKGRRLIEGGTKGRNR